VSPRLGSVEGHQADKTHFSVSTIPHPWLQQSCLPHLEDMDSVLNGTDSLADSEVMESSKTKTVAAYVEDIAVNEPQRLFAWIPSSTDIDQDWIRISYSQLIDMTNKLAWWIESKVNSLNTNLSIIYMG